MEKSQSEVTDKIRHSIKEKLKKMNTFVDDELPEYIMILIANKRSKHHMEKDLSLFLGNQTGEFTNWLWDLVSAFKTGGKTKSSKSNLSLDSQNIEEDDVLSYDPTEQDESLFLEEVNESPADKENTSKTEKSEDSKIALSSDEEIPENPYISLSAADKVQQKITIKREIDDSNISKNEVSKTSSNGQSLQKSAKVYPMQRMKPASNTAPTKESVSVKSSELPKTEYSGVASVVCFTQRKYGGATAALQANKLLLRAVNDATKSVLSGKNIKDYYKPTPIIELAENKMPDGEINEIVHTEKKAFDGLINDQDTKLVKYEMQEPNTDNSENTTSRKIVSLNSVEIGIFDGDSSHQLSTSDHKPVKIEEENAVTPHFIVTLDGVNFSSVKRKRSIISEEEPMDIDEEEEDYDEVPEQNDEKKMKIAERCKYWPACKNNVECAYHHPTVPCKSFPNCKFGDKCLYIHPNCKFDARCSKRDCPYTHCSIRKYPIAPIAVIKPLKIQKSKIVCKYYPRCTAKSCPFIHPKLCKFGTQCHAPKCPFGHFQIPNRSQMKWKAV
ncbi:zinc finger CCCH domain-containing protein 14 [Parasteatoda tepidariorum]|uniref:zinc finger CCCH domain-containing protein 14 n=1 Tax=Parasteatoda tepidariorum TaxID=114398 RepID=UPI00077FA47A|nr:zinc finger CCCH domain-containing protein 14 [Parasteatoda tepidariorum]